MIFLSSSSHVHVFPSVFNALTQRAGKKVTLPTLVSLTGFTETQIQSAIASARRTNATYRAQIQVTRFAREWRFVENAAEGVNYPTADKIVKDVEMGSHHIWKRVFAALAAHEGKIVSREELAKYASTDESPITPHQAANAMLTIMRQPGLITQIKVINAGRNWRYTATSAKPSVKTSDKGLKPVSSSIRNSVHRYLLGHPDEVLTSTSIGQELGFTEKQVQNAMYTIIGDNPDYFLVLQRGHSWRYVPTGIASLTSTNGQTSPQAYTPEAAATTLPVNLEVPRIPAVSTMTLPLKTTEGEAVTTRVAQSAPSAGGRLFEEIGQLTDGAILVKESETSAIYRATPLA